MKRYGNKAKTKRDGTAKKKAGGGLHKGWEARKQAPSSKNKGFGPC